jgi:CelD/BcsL family acetyltransferase involved in cellulose biosynthesis
MRLPTPATFSHPDWTRAISAHVAGSTLVQVPASGLPRLSGLLQRKRWPVAYYDSWLTALTPTGLPAAGLPPRAEDALALLDSTEAPILFRNMRLEHPVAQALLAAASQQKTIKSWQRAALNLSGSFDDWLMQNFDQKRRKELKRLRARLGEQGQLQSVELESGGDVGPFLEAFLTLEAKGWKGQRGTAVANDTKMKQGFAAGLTAMHCNGRLKFWQINLDGRPIASLFALVDDGEATLGKIAHDEDFAKYSPGVLIILDATATLMGQQELRLADSNAMPNHPMIDRIWRDRITCADILLAGPSTPSPVFTALGHYIGMKAAARDKAKRVLAQWIGRKIS